MSQIPVYNSASELIAANAVNESAMSREVDATFGINAAFTPSGCGQYVDNAVYIGEPEQWHEFDADRHKKQIDVAEDAVRKVEAILRLPNDPIGIRQRIDKVVLSSIDEHKDDYADAKKELLDLGIESISDNYLFDDYFNEKYGGSR